MSKKGHRIAKEIKDETIAKIKHEGLSVTDAYEDHLWVAWHESSGYLPNNTIAAFCSGLNFLLTFI